MTPLGDLAPYPATVLDELETSASHTASAGTKLGPKTVINSGHSVTAPVDAISASQNKSSPEIYSVYSLFPFPLNCDLTFHFLKYAWWASATHRKGRCAKSQSYRT